MSIEARIMHVPGSRPFPEPLTNAFEAFHPLIMQDPAREGPWANARRCMTAPIHPSTSHLLILNDDVLPTPGVVENVRAVAAYGRPTFVTLYSYHRQLSEARLAGANWIETYLFTWGCAQLIPVNLIPSFLAFNDRYLRDDWNIDDTRWCLYAIARGQPNYVFAPSLVDHRSDWDSIHIPGKVHRQTTWLSEGPLVIGDGVVRQKEQDGAAYMASRGKWFKGEIPKPGTWTI